MAVRPECFADSAPKIEQFYLIFRMSTVLGLDCSKFACELLLAEVIKTGITADVCISKIYTLMETK